MKDERDIDKSPNMLVVVMMRMMREKMRHKYKQMDIRKNIEDIKSPEVHREGRNSIQGWEVAQG